MSFPSTFFIPPPQFTEATWNILHLYVHIQMKGGNRDNYIYKLGF